MGEMLCSVSFHEILLHLRIPYQNRIVTVSFWQIFHLLRHFFFVQVKPQNETKTEVREREKERERETWGLGFWRVKKVLRKVLRRQSLAFFIQKERHCESEAEWQRRQPASCIVMVWATLFLTLGLSPIICRFSPKPQFFVS